jgi:hypothetical protein
MEAVDIYLYHSYLGTIRRWVVSIKLRILYFREKSPRGSRSGRYGEEKNLASI